MRYDAIITGGVENERNVKIGFGKREIFILGMSSGTQTAGCFSGHSWDARYTGKSGSKIGISNALIHLGLLRWIHGDQSLSIVL